MKLYEVMKLQSTLTKADADRMVREVKAFYRDKEWNHISDDTEFYLMELFADEIPYGTLTGDDETLDEWFAKRKIEDVLPHLQKSLTRDLKEQ